MNDLSIGGRILKYLTGCGEHGSTDEETQAALSVNESNMRPRRRELQLRGFVADSGRVRRCLSGRIAIVWIVTESGIAAAQRETINGRAQSVENGIAKQVNSRGRSVPIKRGAYAELVEAELLRDPTRTLREIAAVIGCGNATVGDHRARMLKAGKLKAEDLLRTRIPVVTMLQKAERIRELFSQGHDLQQTANEIGMPLRSLGEFCRRHKIKTPYVRIAKAIDPNRVLITAVNTLSALASTFRETFKEASRFESVDREQLPGWVASISESLSTIQARTTYLRKTKL